MLTIQNSLDVPSPNAYPTSMVRYGLNPHSEPMFRVVYAPSVKKLIFGTNGKGETGAHCRMAYRQIGAKWIMEKWLSGYEATRMTPKEYEDFGPRDPQSGMLIEGPYPSKGVYHHCWTFDGDTLHGGMEGAIDKIVALINHGAKRSFSEIKAANKELDAKEEKRAADERFLRVRETESCFGIRPASVPGGPRVGNLKSLRNPITADKTGLPTKRGSVMALKGPTIHASI